MWILKLESKEESLKDIAIFWNIFYIEALVKLPIYNNCHSERSEKSHIFKRLRSCTSFRMTEKPVLQEALL